MAISEDTTALVAAQLTAAWATRVGHAGTDDAGDIGPNLLGVYRKFVSELESEAAKVADANTAAWLDFYKTT
jgi:hypothetical protein